MSKQTPGPWVVGEFSDFLGYDCMTAGVRAGPACLDGADYGQKRVAPITDAQKERMMADAYLIAAAPDFLEAVLETRKLVSEAAMTGFNFADGDWAERLFLNQGRLSAAIRKAEGRP